MNKTNIIRCPHCGAEYLPEEIFYPDSVFNKNLKVTRDEEGKIVYISDEYFCLSEDFECEHCGKAFKVEGKTTFNTKEVKLDDFEEETVIKL